MADARSGNTRNSSRFPVMGDRDGTLDLPGGVQVAVRIEDESAGGFGVFCNADVSVWPDEVVLLHRGDDTFEVRVAHVAEIEVPRRGDEPAPAWLPLRIGLERRRMVSAAQRPRAKGAWRAALHRQAPRPMLLTGLLLATAFAAAMMFWASIVDERQGGFLNPVRGAGVNLLRTVARLCGGSKDASSDGDAHKPASPLRKTAEQTQQAADEAKKQFQARVAPLQLRANAAIDRAKWLLKALAQRVEESRAALREDAARKTDRLIESSREAFESARDRWESSASLDDWNAMLDDWATSADQWATGFGGPPSGPAPTAAPGGESPADPGKPTTESSRGTGSGAVSSPTPPPSRPAPQATSAP